MMADWFLAGSGFSAYVPDLPGDVMPSPPAPGKLTSFYLNQLVVEQQTRQLLNSFTESGIHLGWRELALGSKHVYLHDQLPRN